MLKIELNNKRFNRVFVYKGREKYEKDNFVVLVASIDATVGNGG